MNRLPLYAGVIIFVIGCIVACSKVGRKEEPPDLSKKPPVPEERIKPTIEECKKIELRIIGETEMQIICIEE